MIQVELKKLIQIELKWNNKLGKYKCVKQEERTSQLSSTNWQLKLLTILPTLQTTQLYLLKSLNLKSLESNISKVPIVWNHIQPFQIFKLEMS